MTDPPSAYVGAWVVACIVAVAVGWRRRRDLTLLSAGYRRFLCQPWRLGTGIVAIVGLTVVAPHTGDPYWDYTVALLMGVCTWLSAPWVVGLALRWHRHPRSLAEAYVAACAWLFSASWSYDGWNLIRLGHYPLTWIANIGASTGLYVLAGLMWSLDWSPERGVHLATARDDWPDASPHAVFLRLLPYAAPIMLVVGFAILNFVFNWWLP